MGEAGQIVIVMKCQPESQIILIQEIVRDIEVRYIVTMIDILRLQQNKTNNHDF